MAARRRGITRCEGSKETCLHLWRDARTGVTDFHAQHHSGPFGGNAARRYPYKTLLGERDGVIEEIENHLRKARGISPEDRRHGGVCAHVKAKTLLVRTVGDHAAGFLEDGGRAEVHALQRQASSLDTGYVDGGIDALQKVTCPVEDHREPLQLLFVQRAERKQVRRTHDVAHRRAEFVGDVAQERICGPHGCLGIDRAARKLGVQLLNLALALLEFTQGGGECELGRLADRNVRDSSDHAERFTGGGSGDHLAAGLEPGVGAVFSAYPVFRLEG